MSYKFCGECGKEIGVTVFNFCPHCGKRIEGPFNELVEFYTSQTIPEEDDPDRHPAIPHCNRCIWVILDDFHEYCCMCGYALDEYALEVEEKPAENDQVPIFLGRFDYVLDSDEYALFSQADVAWYGDTFNHRDKMYIHTSIGSGNVRIGTFSESDDGLPDVIFDIIAAGTLYLTNKRVILYDPGFSNIWTRLSASGDFPEQIQTIHLNDIREVHGDLHRIDFKTFFGDVQLAPSNRQYNRRKTPIVSEYRSFSTFYQMLTELLIAEK